MGAIHHKNYSIATYVKEDVNDTRVAYKDKSKNIQILSTKCGINERV